tara:strand:+ start:99 stop:344 length:246 start_codon:yes stop_codon:yes gene_type:complete
VKQIDFYQYLYSVFVEEEGVEVTLEYYQLLLQNYLQLLNMHQVTMRPYKSISSRHVWMSWLPNLLMSGVMAGILASALLYV